MEKITLEVNQNLNSIDIFVDDKLEIAFIPTLKNKIGFGQETSYFKLLDPPYTLADIGSTFIQVLNDMRSAPMLDGGEDTVMAYKIIAGGKGYLAFQRKRQMIMATFSGEIKFKYWYRKKRGFGIDKDDEEITVNLPLECTPDEIGKAIEDVYFQVNDKTLVGEC